MQNKTVIDYDIVIIGGGMVGASLAGLLANTTMKIAIIEPFPSSPIEKKDAYDIRVSAISPFSKQVLKQAGAWRYISEQRYQPYDKMEVWDALGMGRIRFSAAEMGLPELGFIIENKVIQSALWSALTKQANVVLESNVELNQLTHSDDRVTLLLSDGRTITTSLLVGADGAKSKVRQLASIYFDRKPYHQKALVTTVKVSESHNDASQQCFLPSGPLAFLPLPNNYCSIVWTLPSDKADYMYNLSDHSFKKQLAQAFDYQLGDIVELGLRGTFPLQSAQAERYIADRLVLIGDAAHVIHPLAGQGVNLGIKDSVELAKQLTGETDAGRYKTLRRYEMARRGDTLLTQKSMEGFNRLFSNNSFLLSSLRNTGLMMVDTNKLIKKLFIGYAIGGG